MGGVQGVEHPVGRGDQGFVVAMEIAQTSENPFQASSLRHRDAAHVEVVNDRCDALELGILLQPEAVDNDLEVLAPIQN